MANTSTPLKEYRVPFPIDWCPGCGDFGILSALQNALADMGLAPHEVAIFAGIGCSGKAPYYVSAYGVHTLHGRVLPFATGAKLANPSLTVIAVGGDGDGLGIGAGHFVNTGRRNIDLTYIVFNNEVYGLTKGQAAPTLALGMQTKSLPQPTMQAAVNPPLLALASGFTWIGRGYAYRVKPLAELIQQAIRHRGLSFLEVIQPCPTYNDIHTKAWFEAASEAGKDRLYSLQEDGYDPVIDDETDEETRQAKLLAFLQKAMEAGERVPLGVFLDNRSQATLEDHIATRLPFYRTEPPARRAIAGPGGRPAADLSALFKELTVG